MLGGANLLLLLLLLLLVLLLLVLLYPWVNDWLGCPFRLLFEDEEEGADALL